MARMRGGRESERERERERWKLRTEREREREKERERIRQLSRIIGGEILSPAQLLVVVFPTPVVML